MIKVALEILGIIAGVIFWVIFIIIIFTGDAIREQGVSGAIERIWCGKQPTNCKVWR